MNKQDIKEILVVLFGILLIISHLFVYVQGLHEGEQIQKNRLVSYVVFPVRQEKIIVGGRTMFIPKQSDVDKLIELLQNPKP